MGLWVGLATTGSSLSRSAANLSTPKACSPPSNRRAAKTFEEFSKDRGVLKLLREIDALRRERDKV